MSFKKNSVMLFISKTVYQLVSMVSMMLLSRSMQIGDYGEYKQFFLGLSVADTVLNLGLPSAVIYYVSSKDREKNIPNILFIMLMLSGLVILLGKPYSIIFDYSFKTSFFSANWMLFSLFSSMLIFNACTENFLIAVDKVGKLLFYSVIPNALFLGCIVWSCFYDSSSMTVIYINLVRTVLMFVMSVFFYMQEKPQMKKVDVKTIRAVLFFGLPIGLSAIVGIINSNIDKFVIGFFYDNQVFAVFTNGAYEIPIIGLIGASIFGVAIPRIKQLYSDNKLKDLNDLWLRIGRMMCTLIIPIGTGLILFSDVVVNILYSAKYSEATLIFAVYQTVFFVRVYSYGSIFVAAGKSKLYMINTIISFVFNFILDIVLVKFMGPVGAAIATVITTYFLMMLQIWQIGNILGKKIHEVFPWKEWFLSIGVAVGINGFLRLLYNAAGSSVIVGVLCACGGFGLTFFILGKSVSNELGSYMKQILKKPVK